jgi:hypothetical protein
MNLPTTDNDCDDCVPSYLKSRGIVGPLPSLSVVISTLPFVITLVAVITLAQYRLLPLISSDAPRPNHDRLPAFNKDAKKDVDEKKWRARVQKPSAKRVASGVFSTSIGLSAVLVELLLCEVSNFLRPAARALALRWTLGSLLILVILVTPALEIHGSVKVVFGPASSADATPTTSRKKTKWKGRTRLMLELAILISWLLVFWHLPQASILRQSLEENEKWRKGTDNHFSEKCLERVGIIGISLMASLSGFAAVSSIWQTFGARYRRVEESDITRKTNSLNVTEELLAAKQSRSRALLHKMNNNSSSSPTDKKQPSLVGRVLGAFSTSPESTELRALQMEIAGLETMRFGLSASLSNSQSQYTAQLRSQTRLGRILQSTNYIFAVYCAYRILATLFFSLRRWWHPAHSFATADPINNILALMTSHWDHDLDRAAWSRQFSFLLSGVMLLASFSAVLQTFRIFARFAPGVVQHAQTSLPLIISQVAGTYVIASAILLGSNLPREISGTVTEALGTPLEPRFVEGWFEGWFLVAVGLTAAGIWVGRKLGGGDDGWDDYDDDGRGGGKRS